MTRTKILDVKAYLLPKEANPLSFQWRAGLPGSDPVQERAVIRVVTDEGIDGFAEAQRGVIALDIVHRRLKSALVGENPLWKEKLWKKIWEIDRIEELPLYLLGTIDTALWDITSKVAGLPLYQLLGGYRSTVPAYASTVTFATIDEYLTVADQCLATGFTAIKLHAWGDVRRDAALAKALRRHVGDEIDLMYDGSAAYDFHDAVRLGHTLEEEKFRWYEEPMREFSISSYERLRSRLGIPLLVAETSEGCHYNTADFIAFHAGDIVRTSTGLKGGVTGAMRIAHLADAFQLRAEVHGGGIANLHVACAIPNTTYYESLVMSNPVIREPLVNDQGLASVPETPGVGYAFDVEDLQLRATAQI